MRDGNMRKGGEEGRMVNKMYDSRGLREGDEEEVEEEVME